MSKSNSLIFLISLFIWVLCWRLPGFTQVVTTWDESLYFMIARDWLHNGVLPYTGIFDHKPIGIYLIFSAAIACFGDAVTSIRIATVIFVFLTSWAVYKLSSRWLGEIAGRATALIYPVLMLGMDGETSNTELFFPTFTVWAAVFLQYYLDKLPTVDWRALITSGLLFGCAIATKYLVVFEAFYLVGIGLLIVLLQKHLTVKQLVSQLGVIIVAACTPTAIAFIYYALNHQTDAFLYGNFIANSKHLARDPLPVILADLLSSTMSWARWSAPAFLVFALSSIARPISKRDFGIIFFLAGWLAATLCEAWVTLKFYPHYYNLTFIPLTILTGWSIQRLTPLENWRVLAIGLFLTLSWGHKTIKNYYGPWIQEYLNDANIYEEIANYINPTLSPSDRIYVVNDQPILYFLTKNPPPTKYAYPAFITDPHFNFVAGVEPRQEIQNILQQNPKYVILANVADARSGTMNPVLEYVLDQIKNNYAVDKRVGYLDIYRRIN